MKLDLGRTRADDVLIDAFGPSVYVIGGPVRDKLREVFHGVPFEPKDRDYVVVGFTLQQVLNRLAGVGRIDPVGASFGVLKLTIDGEPTVDVSLPRRERSTGWGHKDFVVDSGAHISVEEDQGRRDFLMNAVAVQLMTGELVEHPGAIEDIRRKRITAVNGRKSFLEDPLRILRAAQFASRFGFDITAQTFASMQTCGHLVGTVSPERINEELTKLLLRSGRPSRGIRILHEAGLLPRVIAGLESGAGVEQNIFHARDVLDHNLATVDASRPTLVSRWAALLHDIGKPATRSAEKGPHGYTFYNHERVGAQTSETILRGLRYPNALVEKVGRLVANHMYVADATQSDATVKRFINRVGVDLLDDQFHLRMCDKVGSGRSTPESEERNRAFVSRVYDILARRAPLDLKDLAVNGRDVIEELARIQARPDADVRGPQVGRILNALRDRVIDEPELNTKDKLRHEIASIVAALGRSGD